MTHVRRNRVERFFLSSVEGATDLVRGMRVQLSGRLGRKAEMAEIMGWVHGVAGGGWVWGGKPCAACGCS